MDNVLGLKKWRKDLSLEGPCQECVVILIIRRKK
jgi:hypothetical protein